ncbi:hypothetical protein GCM10017600_72840 [Streptosporangium carneum]|uniref:Uncharacterized protein n=1 Tax=Streptosporangium carneum TaxID=47481 RepID=A0A9W6MHC1_9ACTN|nr:hypothetical protein GCM10017600_72840 [Streptosporangium carneum]
MCCSPFPRQPAVSRGDAAPPAAQPYRTASPAVSPSLSLSHTFRPVARPSRTLPFPVEREA